MDEQPALTPDQTARLEEDGYVRVDNVLTLDQVKRYGQLYDAFLVGNISTGHFRSDLGGHVEDDAEISAAERITQIM